MSDELAALTKQFEEHTRQDSDNFSALHKKLDGLATKEDIDSVLTFMRRIAVGEKVVLFGWNNMGRIGGVVLFLIAIYGLIKFGVLGAITWFFRLTSGNS